MPIFIDDDDDILSDPEALNTEVMEEAATSDDDPAPEVSRYTARITAWDESPAETSHQARHWPVQSDQTDAEKLVHSGSEEAAREQRAATVTEGDDPAD